MVEVLNKKRQRVAGLVDKLLHIFHAVHSTITFRRFQKRTPIKKVLVYTVGFLGETVMARSTIDALKTKYDVTVVAHPVFKDLLYDYEPLTFLPFWLNYGEKYAFSRMNDTRKFLKQIKKENYDAVIDLRGDMRNNLLLYLTKIPTTIGYGNTGGKYFLSDPVELKADIETERYLDLARHLECNIKDPYAHLPVPKEAEDKVKQLLEEKGVKESDTKIIISPSAGYWTKEWPLERFASLADELVQKHNAKIIFLGAPSDEKYKEVTKLMKEDSINLIGELKILESAALIKNADLFISADTGTAHLAAAVNTKSITLFGPTASRWVPYGKNQHIIKKDQHCSPCGRLNDCPIHKECMTKIHVGEVVTKAAELLNKG